MKLSKIIIALAMLVNFILPNISAALTLNQGDILNFTYSVNYSNKIDLFDINFDLGNKNSYNYDIGFETTIYDDGTNNILINQISNNSTNVYNTNATNVYATLLNLQDINNNYLFYTPVNLAQFNDHIGPDQVRGSISFTGGPVNIDFFHIAFYTAYTGYASGRWYNITDYNIIPASEAAPVPEPSTMMLLGLGMLGLAVYGKCRMNKEA